MSRRTDDPKPGFFKMALVKGGPLVGCRLKHCPARDPETGEKLDRSPMWETWIGTEMVRPPSPDPTEAGVWRVWMSATEISQQEYRHLIADRDWCTKHAPSHPFATPNEPVRIATVAPQHFMPRRSNHD